MARDERTIYVYEDWSGGAPSLIGNLYVQAIRGKELFSFEYNEDWLRSVDKSIIFDPDLHFFEGRQYTANKPLFGVFADSCPDRWGRLLMNRREAFFARNENRKPRALTESDYLLGVSDESRMGALRFKTEESGVFLASDESSTVPPWTTLRALESASRAFESDENGTEEKWLRQLLAPGSSLGGARPKASVQAPDGSLWIAKFPSKHDEWNSGAWEMVARDLASSCGLNVPQAMLEKFSDTGDTYLVKRFDRNNDGRIHFLSAMSMLRKTDGQGSDGASYLDIASFIKSNGVSPKRDLRELWKRVVFSMAISNTDDHLRNHGFLLTENGWELSPAFDVNPNIYGNSLSLNVNENDNSINFDLALETAGYYGIDSDDAEDMLREIRETVQNSWRDVAGGHGLNRQAIERMKPAFMI